MSRSLAGRLGFQATTDKYFGGDVQAHKDWLSRYGFFIYVRCGYPWSLLPGGKLAGRHPGSHPAWPLEQSQPCPRCTYPVRDCVCRVPAF